MYLLSKLFSEMCFLFYGQAFDDAMTFENVEFWNLIFLRTKRAFEIKNIFPTLTSTLV